MFHYWPAKTFHLAIEDLKIPLSLKHISNTRDSQDVVLGLIMNV